MSSYRSLPFSIASVKILLRNIFYNDASPPIPILPHPFILLKPPFLLADGQYRHVRSLPYLLLRPGAYDVRYKHQLIVYASKAQKTLSDLAGRLSLRTGHDLSLLHFLPGQLHQHVLPILRHASPSFRRRRHFPVPRLSQSQRPVQPGVPK